MKVIELLKIVEKAAQDYRPKAINSIKRNTHLHDCSSKDIGKQDFVDAILGDFINSLAASYCVDYGIRACDIYWPEAMDEQKRIEEIRYNGGDLRDYERERIKWKETRKRKRKRKMKIRNGFVSNSSTSSFVCDLCGRSEADRDMEIDDAEMIICVNDHTICIEEMVEDFHFGDVPREKRISLLIESFKDIKDTNLEYNKLRSGDFTEEELEDMWEDFWEDYEYDMYYDVEEKYCPICQMLEFSNDDLSAYLLKKTGITREEVFATVKEANKRRKKLYDNEYVIYALQKSGISMESLLNEIKDKFSSYKDFNSYMCS